VCLVSDAFVRRLLGARPAIGTRIALRPPDTPDAAAAVREIVGVVRQVAGRPDEREPAAQIYVPLAQAPRDDIYLLVRPAAGAPEALTAPVRAAIARVDREQLVSVRDIRTLADVAREATARHRFRAVLVGVFAAIAVLLAMAGVYGVVAYAVQLRGRELALRRALGATTAGIVRAVLAGTLAATTVGATIGGVVAIAAGRLLRGVLAGVTPLDAVTWTAALAVLLAVTVLAVVGPLRRAARLDPAAELRNA
jgi:putative ABC transport system permease protein